MSSAVSSAGNAKASFQEVFFQRFDAAHFHFLVTAFLVTADVSSDLLLHEARGRERQTASRSEGSLCV